MTKQIISPPWFSLSLAWSARQDCSTTLSCHINALRDCKDWLNCISKVLTPPSIPTGIPNFSPLQCWSFPPSLPHSLKLTIFAFELHFEQSLDYNTETNDRISPTEATNLVHCVYQLQCHWRANKCCWLAILSDQEDFQKLTLQSENSRLLVLFVFL